MIQIPELISSVVSSFKSSGSITSVVQNTTTQTIHTQKTGNLSNGLYVTIENENYQISNLIVNHSFDIVRTTAITNLTWQLACNYTFGHPIEIANRLDQWDKDSSLKFMKFPVICLFLDNGIEVDSDEYNNTINTALWLAIVTNTDRNYTAQERLDNKFKTILQPLYELFISYLKKSQYVINNDSNKLQHTKIDRYFYGSEDKNQNVLNAYADAIEIKNLKLKLYNSNVC